MERLYRNRGGYRGETVDPAALLAACESAGRREGWRIEHLSVAGRDHPLVVLRREARRQPTAGPSRRIYLSAGIHGDEPAGPLAVQTLLESGTLPDTHAFWVVPCLNPAGLAANRRENPDGIDLNRDYRHLRSPEVRAHVAWLLQQPSFDLCFCLHEDWEASGFYLYELNPDDRPSLAPAMLQAVREVCPLDLSPVIEGRPAHGGLIRPDIRPETRPEWPEAFWLLQQGHTRWSYTLEAPSDYALPVRVQALTRAVQAALHVLGNTG
ncbi:M14 family metallopeptidase [Limisphaera sp. VF-2]|jgi:protein MpaA|uniref:M14 family metallopeptidase n=1 Tax=Limisphaera sp. VF-2 TaxID=3400418 RepID=UPI00176BE5D5